MSGARVPGGPVGGEGQVDIAQDVLPAEAYAAALAGLPNMGPARLAVLLAAQSPAEAWESIRNGRWPAATWPGRGAPDSLLPQWRTVATGVDVAEAWAAIARIAVGVALRGRPGFPPLLDDDVEPPEILFHRGDLQALGPARVAVVGTRRCTSTGSGVAFELGHDLAAEGVTVISGLASGIDAAAHRGALHAGEASPVGVVATGLDVVYPRRQHRLWQDVAEAGVLLGEAPPGTQPERWRFPARNRIIAALADLVVVVESHAQGGALHTVDEADRRGTEVLAVPGSVRGAASAGTNNLLAEGRVPVRDAGDVLMALGLTAGQRAEPPADPRLAPTSEGQRVLDALGWQPATLDALVLRSRCPVPELVEVLGGLIESGWVVERGGWYEQVAPGRHLPGFRGELG